MSRPGFVDSVDQFFLVMQDAVFAVPSHGCLLHAAACSSGVLVFGHFLFDFLEQVQAAPDRREQSPLVRVGVHHQTRPLPAQNLKQRNEIRRWMQDQFVFERHVQRVGLEKAALQSTEHRDPAGMVRFRCVYYVADGLEVLLKLLPS